MSSNKAAKKYLRPQTQRLVLEPRIVFDAVIPAMAAEAIFPTADLSNTETLPPIEAPAALHDANQSATQTQAFNEDTTTASNAVASPEILLIEGTLAPTNLNATEIIFVDALVADLQQYLTGYPNADVVLLDSTKDGVEQIAAALAGRTGIESVHIISHGGSGQLTLGNSVFNLNSLQGEHADELATIKAALSETADILIYGCNVAEGQAGQAFVDALRDSTGADIAASTNNTGAAALGADWVLETQVGTVAATTLSAKDWQNVLADTDGDGIDDSIDLDDDNDGILDTIENAVRVTSLSQTVGYSYAQTAGIPGFTAGFRARHFGAFGTGTADDPKNFFDANVGTELRTHAGDIIEINLGQTVRAGSFLTLTEGAGANDADIAVYASFGTTDAAGDANSLTGGGVGWATLQTKIANGTAVLLYSGPSTTTVNLAALGIDVTHLQIVGLGSHGGWAEFGYTSLNQTYGGVDTDGDGKFNSVDLDSDNDGISDLFESTGGAGDATADTNNNGTVSLAEAIAAGAAGDGDLDNDGLLDIFDANTANTTGAASLGNTPINTDNDIRADFLDLDSDADGIADTIEARLSLGYVTNDGDVRNDDGDGDGVIGLFDNSNAVGGAFGGNFIRPVNTDAQGAPYTADATTFTGTPTRATFVSSVANITTASITAILAQDAAFAQLNRGTDRFALNLGQVLPAGATISIRAQRTGANAANTLRISQSSNGLATATLANGRLTNQQSLGFASTAYQTVTYILTAPTQFIDLGFNRAGNNLNIDSVAWSYTTGTQYDYIDTNSDNDATSDKLESGLTLTGVDVNQDGIDDGVGASYADPDGNVNAPLGNTTGLKNNDAAPTDVDFRSLNIGGVDITSIAVNEGSPFAVFSLSRVLPAPAAVIVKLTLQTGDGDPATADAIIGTDTGTQLQVFNSITSTWDNYTPGADVTVPAGTGTLLVRVAITNDNTIPNPAVFEGPELFRLVATTSTNAVSGGGYGTIIDDGTGNVWLGANNTSTPSVVAATTLDDDRPLAISDVTVNEASPFAVFSVAGIAGTPIQLTLGTTGIGAGNAVLGTDTGTLLQTFSSGGAWTNYIAGANINLDVNGELLVRVVVNNDTPAVFEGAETFTLTGKIVGNGITSVGTGTIIDDGTGDIYLIGNLTPDPNLPGDAGYPAALDDDRPIDINNVIVNEASPFAVFQLAGQPGQTFTPLLQNDSDLTTANALLGTDTGILNQLQYSADDGLTWLTYSGTGTIPLNANGELLVRIAIKNDTPAVFEGPENFQLRLTTASGAVTTGNVTINDDGTGNIYPSSDVADPLAIKDDDRALSVTSTTVTEGTNPFAIFTVAGVAGQTVSFTAAGSGTTPATAETNGTLNDGEDFGNGGLEFSLNGGTTWSAYTAGSNITIPAGGSFQVRATITNDTISETDETFALTATYTSGGAKSAVGTGTIKDGIQAPGAFTAAVPEGPVINAAEATSGGGVPVTITLPANAVAGDVITVSIDGSTPVSYTVLAADVFAGTASVLIPTADITAAGQGAAVVTSTYTNAGGNAATPVTTNLTIDTLRPTATIVVTDTALQAGETSLVTISFNEAVTGLTNADLTIANGTLSALSTADGGITWTATFTPSVNTTDATNLISLDNTGYIDAAGNTGLGSTDSNNYAIDTLRPTASIVVADTALQAGETSLVTITFNEAVTGLTNADLTIANGSLTALTSGDGGITWTATFTPSVNTTDATNLISLDNLGYIDAAGNTGLGSTDSNNYAIDTVAPLVTVLELGDRIKTAAEATSAAGVVTVLSEAGSTSVVTFVGVNGTVTKTITNNGTALPVLLTAADLLTLGDGLVEVTTVTTDVAGNVTTSPDTNDGDFTLDTVAPNLPTGALTHNSINDTGVSATDSITGNISPEISGNGTPGDTITLFDTNSNVIGSALVSADGTWTINPVSNYLVNGLNNLTITATDPAGNISAPVTIPVVLDNSAPTAINFVGIGSAEDSIAVVLAGTDEIGVIASITISSVPPASEGTLKLADGTPVAAGAVLSPQQAANLIFVPLPNFNGVATILFFVTDDEGLNSAVASATLTITEVRIQVEGLLPLDNSITPLDSLPINSPVIPIGMPEDLFVIHSVRESAVRIAQSSNFGVFNVDTPTRGELDNLTYDLKGLPVGMDPTLFVQHAVRSLPIMQESVLFVQNAVRQSQLESSMRNIGVSSFNSATNGVSSLFSVFDLGSVNDNIDLAVDGVNGEFSDKKAETNVTLPTELALDPINETVVDINTIELPATKEVDVKVMVNKLIQAKLTQPAEAKKVAAASFANQLNAAAKKFKSNDIFNTH